ncbi:mechanosensitive ion channel family protein [Actinomadura fulvescens]|uniref:Mechanosensitive ion channel family protein n=1 Tax=Actinomadura fulvescens TaxID=46160 RepID=A0ABP6BYV9_9ACTN
MSEPTWAQIISSISVVVGALVLAVVLRVAAGRLTRRAGDTRWAWDDLIAKLLHDLAIPVAITGGGWIATLILEPEDDARNIVAKVLSAAIILAVTFALARLIAGIVTSVTLARQGPDSSITIFGNITRVIVIGIGLLVMLQGLGVSITPLLGALGVGGLAVALALQDTLANLFAGVHVLASKTMEPGDYIKLSSGQEGYVVDINWRNTSIRTLSDNIEVIPNAEFSKSILTNFHRPAQDMSLLVQASVAYDSDLERVEKVVTEVGAEVMNEVEGGVKDAEILVRFHTFADSSINFTVILRINEFGEQFRIKHEFIKRLHRRFRAEGIEIPFPTRQLLLPNGQAKDLAALDRPYG